MSAKRTSVARDSVVLAGGSALQMVIALVTVPTYLTRIGDARFGLFVIVLLILGYFGIIDRALGAGVTTEIARLDRADMTGRSTLVWTAAGLSLVVGVVSALALLGVGRVVLGGLVSTTEELRVESLDALPALALCLPVLTFTAAFHGALSGGDHFFAVSVLDTVRVSAMQLLPLGFVIWQEPTLEWLAAGVLAALAISAVCVVGSSFWLELVSLRPVRPERAIALDLFHFGKWISVSSIVSPLLDVTDRIAIGAIRGASAVTVYSVPYNLASRLLIAAMSLIRAVFPRFSAMHAEGARALGATSVSGLAAITAPAAVVGATLMAPFLEWWIGGDLAVQAAPVGAILCAGVWVNGIGAVPNVLLQGQGRPDLVARIHALELVPFLFVLVAAVYVAGPVGAAVAWSLRALVDTVLLLHFAAIPSYRNWRLALLAGLVVLGACSGALLSSSTLPQIAIGLLLATVTAVAAWLLAPLEVRESAVRALSIRSVRRRGDVPTDVPTDVPSESADDMLNTPVKPCR